jgi:hypothetical protein
MRKYVGKIRSEKLAAQIYDKYAITMFGTKVSTPNDRRLF